jgi:hypothetical protein
LAALHDLITGDAIDMVFFKVVNMLLSE